MYARRPALPVRGPRIEILDSSGRPKSPKAQEISYAVGDKIELRCNSAPSKPAARLRWYINEHELAIPAAHSSVGGQAAGERQRQRRLALASAGGGGPSSGQQLGYDVRVTPIEYRQHYKGIYSSHSALTLVLQQDDLINNKISFKCLASMRQEVAIRSKQLIVLSGSSASSSSSSLLGPSNFRARRSPDLQAAAELIGASDSEAHVYHRQRAQAHRLGGGGGASGASGATGRFAGGQLRQQQQQQQQRAPASAMQTLAGAGQPALTSELLINNLLEEPRNTLMYIYEQADSTLGSSIIDGPENLENYLRQMNASNSGNNNNNNYQAGSAQLLDLSKADNLDYIQLLRERSARQKSHSNALGGGGQQAAQNNFGGPFHSSAAKRTHGSNSLVKSPLYLDELDSLRPIISWPPLDSGRLAMLPAPSGAGATIVAIPTLPSSNRIIGLAATGGGQQAAGANSARRFPSSLASASSEFNAEQRVLVLPTSMAQARTSAATAFGPDIFDSNELSPKLRFLNLANNNNNNNLDLQGQTRQQILLERLARHLNCTCTDGSVDTKLAWLINDSPIDMRDTRYYPTRVSPDHRQTWITIGLQAAAFNQHHQLLTQQQQQSAAAATTTMPNSLSSILARYFRLPAAAAAAAATSSAAAGSLGVRAHPGQATTSSFDNNHQQASTQQISANSATMPAESSHIKFICQAIHSMLLYSSSEMITFDFNPPPQGHQVDANSIDKLAPSPSNVIQATSGKQTGL